MAVTIEEARQRKTDEAETIVREIETFGRNWVEPSENGEHAKLSSMVNAYHTFITGPEGEGINPHHYDDRVLMALNDLSRRGLINLEKYSFH